ncbi:MAG: DUF3854 domain-containing protein [Mycobacterium sp.]|uniref:DUF3854 domain-containing protein n=1 Tax=Mycobacterium sp. TaxID=1785 RepID=UPI003F97C272
MIADHHLRMLAASGIAPDAAASRGYETVTDKKRLAEISITPAGRRAPGLLVPLLDVRGSTWGYQFRPDSPRRLATGRVVKYETPTDQRNGLDVPPGVGPMLGDPAIPLWVTEGSKKADCVAVRGLCCVALMGVWSWRGTNTAGGKVALADWNDVALNGRRVILAYDGDVARKQAVRTAMGALANYLAIKGAHIEYLHLPDTADKTGLDDYLMHDGHVVGDLWGLVRPISPPPPARQREPPPSTPSNYSATAQPPSLEAVQAVARLPRILDSLATEIRSRGLVGEEPLAKTLYLVLTSRLLDKQVSAGVKGHSASGKSYTVETVSRFFPPEAYLEFTGMSEHALVYSPQQFAHRTLIVYEVTALREGVEDDMTSYFVRSLLSEGKIDYEVTIRDKDGGFTTERIVKPGPTNLIFTTTKTQVHAENETRILSLATDDSREQTARVLLELADEGNGDRDLEPWRDLQRWLGGAEHRVTIPFALRLAQQVPPVAVRLRRDFGSLLALIRAHAILHQASRDRDHEGRVVATLDDYAVVRDLVADVIAEGVGATVSETVRQTVAVVGALTCAEGVMVRVVADKLHVDKSNASRRLRVAADGGYVRNLEDRRGRPGRWVIGDPLPEAVDLLPDPAQLATAANTLDLGGCAVARESGGENGGDTDAVLCRYCGDPIPESKPTSRRLGYCTKGACIAARGWGEP